MMWPYYYYGWSWPWMAGFMIVFWIGVIVLAVWLIRSLGRSDDDAMAILRRRLAAGEISQDEYEKTRRALQG
jgi:putative membrane protein